MGVGRILLLAGLNIALKALEGVLHRNEDLSKPSSAFAGTLRGIALTLVRITKFILPIAIQEGFRENSIASNFLRGLFLFEQDPPPSGEGLGSRVAER